MLWSMSKERTSVTIDREKLDQVRRLTGSSSASAAIDWALSEMIAIDRLRNDLAAYRQTAPTNAEIALARLTHDWSDLADDTDWEALYDDAEV